MSKKKKLVRVHLELLTSPDVDTATVERSLESFCITNRLGKVESISARDDGEMDDFAEQEEVELYGD